MAVKGLLLVAGFLVLAAFETSPLLAHFGSHLGSQGSDALLQSWILAWDVHALTTHPLRLFDANLMYPLERSLAFSDHLLGVLPLFAPVYLLTGSVVAGFNTVVLLSGALAALGGFALAWWWTRRWWPAIVAGALFGFAPLRLSQVGHLQLLTFFWAPWALVFLDRFLRQRRWRDLWAFALFYWLQVLSSFYLGMMMTLAVALYAGYYAIAVDRGLLGRALVTRVAAFGAASVVVLLPSHLAYLEVQRAWEAAWTTGAMVGYSADVQSYLSAPALINDLYVLLFRPVTPVGAHERLLFPGLVLPALVLLGAFARVHGVAERDVHRARRLFGLIGVIAFVLSLGPYLVIWGVNTRIPMPYLLFYYVVPGWSAMRVPARFAFLVLLAAVPLSALGAQVLAERAAAFGRGTTWRRLAPAAVGLTLVGLFLLELGAKPWPTQAMRSGRDVPEVYRWLARERPGPIVEIPVALPQHEHDYLYFSTVHWLPTVNGRSSFAPSSHDAAKAVLAELPGPRGREYAAALGLRAIVVHGDRLSREERRRWTIAERAGHVRRLAAFGADVVYAVAAVPLAPSLRARVVMPDVLPPATDVRLGLRLDNDDARPWAHGRPHRVDHAVVRWSGPAPESPRPTSVSVVLPLVVGAGESAAIPLRMTTPTTPGRYTVDVALAGQGLGAERRTVEVRAAPRPPTSAEGSDRLAARYLLEDAGRPRVLAPAESLRVKLVAINTGGAVWLARPRGKKGDVALGWRWLDASGRATTPAAGQVATRYDVHPGQTYEFDEWVAVPTEAGRYVLELNLVSGGMGPFAIEPPVKLVVDVAASG
jgi:hypothetical protein